MPADGHPHGAFGLDHPLVTVRDRDVAIQAFRRLGFAPTPVTFHPWGTWTTLIVLERDLIELIGIHDPDAVDGDPPVGGFAFGAFLRDRLEEDEGITLLALHSDDIDEDAAHLARAGVPVTRRIDFRRAVTLPGDIPDAARVSLLILHDAGLPLASQFVCQQHRPHCIWQPEWQTHPNGAQGLAEVVYVASPEDQRLSGRIAAIHGEDAIRRTGDDLRVRTGNGAISILEEQSARERFGRLPDRAHRPAAIAIGVRVRDIGLVEQILRANQVRHEQTAEGRLLVDPDEACNVVIEFREQA